MCCVVCLAVKGREEGKRVFTPLPLFFIGEERGEAKGFGENSPSIRRFTFKM